jgi:hypothetical protein
MCQVLTRQLTSQLPTIHPEPLPKQDPHMATDAKRRAKVATSY